jgi:hypothetical protein
MAAHELCAREAEARAAFAPVASSHTALARAIGVNGDGK